MAFASKASFSAIDWRKVLSLVLAFWISSSVLLDFVIMPSLFVAGMMSQPGFATAGYGIFWIFNRLELLCAALILTGILVQQRSEKSPTSIALGGILFAIAMVSTYFLSPQMSSLGLNLNLFEPAPVPTGMTQLHVGYWLLESCKFLVAGWLLRREF